MRLRILSDLHLEFSAIDLPDLPADIVILAGDTDRGTKGVAWARMRFPGVPVLYVAGNHEHYGERIGRLHEKLREAAAGSNIVILENESFELGGLRFFGATLWTDFALFGDQPSAMLASGMKGTGMNDYAKIRRQDTSRLQPKHTALLHSKSKLALINFLTSGDPSRSVVITHHAPSPRSIPFGYEEQLLSAAYVSNLEPLIVEHCPSLWIHGHIHECRDYVVGNTRVVNNARGYQTKLDPELTGFRSDLVIDL